MTDQSFIESIEGDGASAELQAARIVLASLSTRLLTDKGEALNPEVIEALKIVKEQAEAEYHDAIDVMNKSGIGRGRLNAVKARVKSNGHLRAVAPGESAAGKLVCDFEGMNDAPIKDLIVPFGYRISPEMVVKGEMFAQEVVAHGAVLITGRTRDIDGESAGVRLSWKRGADPWRHRVVDRETIANAAKLVGLAAFEYPVTSSNAKAQVEYLSDFEAGNLASLPTALTTSHLGPQGKLAEHGYLVGREMILPDGSAIVRAEMKSDSMDWSNGAIAFRGASAGDEQLADGYSAEGTLEGWIEAVEAIAKYPRVLATIYASFVPPMLDILGCKNFVLDLGGKTSAGKTTSQRAAASVWGVPDESVPSAAIHTWNVKQVFVERASAVLSGLPMILDDTKLAPHPQFVQDVIYMICEGQGRGRGSVAGMAVTRHWRTVGITSGEQKATSFTNAGGTKMRVVTLQGSPFGRVDDETEKIVNAFDLAIKSNYGHAGRLFVQWLLQNRRFWPEWKAEYQRRIQGYIETAAGKNSGRLAAYVAAITQTASLVHTALDLPFAFADPMKSVWAEISAEADDALGAKNALRYLMSWASQNEHRFDGRLDRGKYGEEFTPSQGIVGRWADGEDYEYIAFLPHIVEELLTSQKYHPEAIFTEWLERGWLDVTSENGFQRRTKLIRVREERAAKARQVRMVVIKRQGVEECES